MRDLLVILPVRGRPDSARRFMKAFRETATAATDVALITDEDDTSSSGLSAELDVMGMTLVRVPTAQKINKAAEACAGSYEALMFMGDDNVPLTPGWDGFLLDALGGCGMAFANDLSPHAGLLPCSVMMSSAIVRALGWMALPGCSHFFIDNCLAGDRPAGRMPHLPARRGHRPSAPGVGQGADGRAVRLSPPHVLGPRRSCVPPLGGRADGR